MLFRAVFWVGLIAVLMPHEPNLGFGSPSPAAALTAGVSNWAQSQVTDTADAADKKPVVKSHTRTLAQVKAEIAAARHPS